MVRLPTPLSTSSNAEHRDQRALDGAEPPATQDADHLETFGSDTPLGRAGQPGEVAPAFVFLASPSDASYVSGTVLGVTGGKPIF